MKRLWIFVLIGLLAITGYAYAAGEDSDVETSAVTLVIPHAAKLVISQSASSKTLAADGDAETDFDTGYTDMPTGKPNLKVSANKNWKLSAKSSGFAAVGTYTKAIGDLQFKHGGLYVTNGFAAFTSLSAVDQDIAANGIGVMNENYDCQYRILLDYTKDVPGTYTATVTYTLATLA